MNYSAFNTTKDHAYNIRRALEYLRAHGENSLEFDRGVYEIYPDLASEGIYCTSNHGVNGFKRIAVLLKDMKDFTIDGGGSEFVMRGIINPIVVDSCENITIRNIKLSTPDSFTVDGEVTEVDEQGFSLRVDTTQKLSTSTVPTGRLGVGEGDNLCYFHGFIEALPDKSKLRSGVGDFWMRPDYLCGIVKKDEKGYDLRFTTPGYSPVKGNHIVLMSGRRDAACILLDHSRNIIIEDYTAYSGLGMGILAQKCENVSVSHMKTECKPDRYFSLNADATHFVNCRGRVSVTDSDFSGQLDDALNVHGVYTRILAVDGRVLTVKYMHSQAKGLDIFDKGDRIRIVSPDSLLPKGEYQVENLEILNNETTLLTLDRPVEAIPGDDCENISWMPEVEFCGNHVAFNRARGILLASGARTVISGNYFNTSGGAILFESNGEYWFESGATNDVVITGNFFDNCHYGSWSRAVIDAVPRAKAEDGRFFHGRIEITGNRFVSCHAAPIKLDNVSEVIVRENLLEDTSADCGFVHCGRVVCDIPVGTEI